MATPPQIETVLLVDDEDDIRTVACMSLEAVGGWSVFSAASGPEGIELAARVAPDVVLLDVMMPAMDGPTTLRELRRRPDTADLPVVFMTARVRQQEIARYLALGAAGVIQKPFDPMRLPAELLLHLAR